MAAIPGRVRTGHPPPVHSDAEVRAWLERVLATEEVWVADVGGRVVALLVLADEWVEQLYVDPDHTGGGIGAQLVVLAKRQRPGGLSLWTFAANLGARRFYERHGFVPTGMTGGDNEEAAPDVRYEWRPARPARPAATGGTSGQASVAVGMDESGHPRPRR